MFVDVEAYEAAHVAEESVVGEGSGDTTVEAHRPIVEETGLLDCLSGCCESTEGTCCCE